MPSRIFWPIMSYASYVLLWGAVCYIHSSETWSIKVQHEVKLDRTELSISDGHLELLLKIGQVTKVLCQKTGLPTFAPHGCKMICPILTPHLIHGPLNPWKVSLPKGILIGSAIFVQYIHVTNTHRHTDHATCNICSNGLHLMHCVQVMRLKNARTVRIWAKEENKWWCYGWYKYFGLAQEDAAWSEQVQEEN